MHDPKLCLDGDSVSIADANVNELCAWCPAEVELLLNPATGEMALAPMQDIEELQPRDER